MEPTEKPTRVVVTDLEIKFGSMIVLLLKLAFAAIPAVIVLALVAALVPFLLQPI